ncbi:RDD family protein [Hymenobacter sp. CRA2]|uniref:RDD family protein n=1 Tax=Hymenobacter sp. CRA2 TaxID=1955620 RepID=UPI00098F7A7C|nr:hypothetical protein B0919_09230 [Hymenobacter sp. CRA2]
MTLESRPLGTRVRLASMLLDHAIVCVLLVPIATYSNSDTRASTHESTSNYIFLGLFLIYALKDSFQGKSLAKRLLKLQVVDNTTGEPASAIRCFVRNLTICLWPIEVLFTLFNPNRRVGDFIVATRVVRVERRV